MEGEGGGQGRPTGVAAGDSRTCTLPSPPTAVPAPGAPGVGLSRACGCLPCDGSGRLAAASRAAISAGVGFSGMAGCTPSTASQCGVTVTDTGALGSSAVSTCKQHPRVAPPAPSVVVPS